MLSVLRKQSQTLTVELEAVRKRQQKEQRSMQGLFDTLHEAVEAQVVEVSFGPPQNRCSSEPLISTSPKPVTRTRR